MLRLPSGEIFINEIKRENSVCFTDSPEKQLIIDLFERWKKAATLIYVKGNIKKVYNREDFNR